MKVIIKGYNEMKYTMKYTAEEKSWEHVYDGVKSFEVREIPKSEILKEADEDCVDEYNEYLILHFTDGDTATFRNSHVDLFLR